MKRLHQPLGRYFDPAVETLSDLMMENPIRQSTDLRLEIRNDEMVADATKASITLPDGRMLEGFVIKRHEHQVQTELMHAMQGADVGAPTVPYIYMPDQNLMFSPLPFAEARSMYRHVEHKDYKQTKQQVIKLVPAETLGALESFARWINKTDDNDNNRVYADAGGVVHAAMIDNGLPNESGMPNRVLRETIHHSRASCRFGARAQAFHDARRTMAKRIKSYPPSRARQIQAMVSEGFKYKNPIAKRTIGRRWTAAPILGLF